MGTANSSHEKENDVPAFKIVLVGAPKSGKSSVFLRYIKNQHVPYYTSSRKPVIENSVRKLNIPGHAIVSVTLWDLPGREDVDLRRTYFRDVDAAIVVVDMSDDTSIEMAGVWRREVLNQATVTQPREVTTNSSGLVESRDENPVPAGDIPVLLLGNKYDVIDKQVREDKENAEREVQDVCVDQMNDDRGSTGEDENAQETKDDPWSYNPSFPPQRGPEPGEKKPACVRLLERICEEHDFLASVMVSSSANDGSVEGAIQSLVRYLVVKKYPHTVEKWRPVTSPAVHSRQGETIPTDMELLGINQFDEIFQRCDRIVKRVDDLCSHQSLAFRRFREACFLLGVLESIKCNLETCVECLKEAFPDENPLQIVEKDGFYHLEVQTTRELNLRKDVKLVFDVFNMELAASSRAILREFPDLVASLQNQEEQLTGVCEQSEVISALEDLTDGQWRVERNRARMNHARHKAEKGCHHTRTMAEKIALAMVW
ncbi:uncharacterized protein LOC135479232 [Liolophura sinensis]|uniref:uncharacterized protein LOC135479232 n=1 Tax=Liolophura sinensis TaxID=3198878 RepID=UPI003158A25D